MSISRRKNGSWLVSVYHPTAPGGRVRKTVKGDTPRADVKALERALVAGLEAGAVRARRGPTLGDALARYWNEHGQHLASWRSERGYLNEISNALGDGTPMADVDVSRITAAAALWRGKVSDSTVNRRLSCLQRAWRRAEDLWGWRLARVPWGRLKLHEPDHGDQSIRPEHREAFLAALPERTRRLFRFALLTGLRRGGILKIEAQHVDRTNGVVHTWSKGRAGGKHTPVPITRAVASLLEEIGVPEVGRLFPLTLMQITRDVHKARKATGLHVQLRRTRHSFAQDLEDAGHGEAITALLHHSDPRLRERYARVRTERMREVLEHVQAQTRAQRGRS